MCKKALITLLLVVAFIVTSCVDKSYDLVNKEITTDVKIEGNTIAVPFGSLKAVILDSLIDVSEIEMLEKNANGVYCVTMDSTFTVEESIDPITFNIEPFEYKDTVEFNKASVDTVRIGGNEKSAEFTPPTISINNLNNELPHLMSSVKTSFDIPKLGELLEVFDKSPIDTYSYTFEKPLDVTTGVQKVACSIDYMIPAEVETIKSIKLGSNDDKNGTLVKVEVTNPAVLGSCGKVIGFRIDFPEIFYLSKNAADKEKNYQVVNNGHSIVLDGFVPKGDKTELSFYISEIKDIDKYIKNINENNRRIQITDSIAYSINYTLSGGMELKKGMKVEDFAFDVNLDVKLSFYDAAGKTNDVRVDFKDIEMNFDCEFDGLEYIDKICSIDFDENESKLVFETKMDKDWLDAFKLKDGYALKITFPNSLYINPDLSKFVGEYTETETEHAFYISDLKALAQSRWELSLKEMNLNLDVDQETGVCILKEKASVGFVNLTNPEDKGCFYLQGLEMESMVTILDKLNSGDKSAHFKMYESGLVIEDAVVITNTLEETLTANTTFEIDEEIPTEIKRIENIGFKNDVLVTMQLDVDGLGDLDAEINLNMNMSLPSFLKLKPHEDVQGITVNEGLLSIQKTYNPSDKEPLLLKLWCTGIDFRTDEFGSDGLVPAVRDDDNSYIEYKGDIAVDGKATITSTEFHSTVLDKEVYLNLRFEVDEISVKTFHGVYDAEIEGVDEKIDLDLGEELEFLREDGNSITLADPQLELVLMNPVGIPVDVDLHIWGNDENGEIIAESEIATKVSILPAMYDEKNDSLVPVETKLFLSTDTASCSKIGYDNIEIPNLANLLKRIPYSINMNVEPVVRTDSTHHVDISKPIKLDAAYSVVVPLRFDDLHLCYNDTITDLDSSLGETMDMFSNISLSVKMDVVNTIPLGLSLSVTPLDVNGNVIDGIEIDGLNVAAGSGSALVGADGIVGADHPTQKFAFTIKSKSGDISSLDGLAFSLVAASDHTTGTAALKGEQGIKISNIVFEVSGDIEVDLNEMDF